MKKINDKIITIDGPSGVGKGTLARFLAEYLDWSLLDSGSIYRAFAYFCKKNKLDTSNIQLLEKAAQALPISFKASDNKTEIFLENENITEVIRLEEIGMLASKVSANQSVRDALMGLQKKFSYKGNGLVADGRDMGTIVFPEAKLKIFLDAKAEVRAKRRFDDLVFRGENPDFNEVLDKVIQRDQQDRDRVVAPLKAADDAIIIDTSSETIASLEKKVIQILKKNRIGS